MAAVPEVAVRLAGALLAVAVAVVHVADQGGVRAFSSPGWIGWGFRLIEAGGVLTALALLLPPMAGLGPASRARTRAGRLRGRRRDDDRGRVRPAWSGAPAGIGHLASWCFRSAFRGAVEHRASPRGELCGHCRRGLPAGRRRLRHCL